MGIGHDVPIWLEDEPAPRALQRKRPVVVVADDPHRVDVDDALADRLDDVEDVAFARQSYIPGKGSEIKAFKGYRRRASSIDATRSSSKNGKPTNFFMPPTNTVGTDITPFAIPLSMPSARRVGVDLLDLHAVAVPGRDLGDELLRAWAVGADGGEVDLDLHHL